MSFLVEYDQICHECGGSTVKNLVETREEVIAIMNKAMADDGDLQPKDFSIYEVKAELDPTTFVSEPNMKDWEALPLQSVMLVAAATNAPLPVTARAMIDLLEKGKLKPAEGSVESAIADLNTQIETGKYR